MSTAPSRARVVQMVTLAAVMLVGPLLFGGAMGWTVPIIVAIALLGLAVTALTTRGVLAVTTTDGVVATGLVWTFLQAVPLPAWAQRPGQQEVAFSYALAGLPERWTPLSLDPGATWEKIVVGVGILSAYFIGRLHGQALGRSKVLTVALVPPLAVVVLGIAHELLGAERVYGLYEPVHARPALLGPLINTNHLGAVAAFGATLGLGLTVAARGARRALFATIAVVCAAGSIAATSRGAVAGLLIGIVWFGLYLVGRQRRSTRERGAVRGRLAVVGAVVVAMIGAGAYVGYERLHREFVAGDMSKLDLIGSSLRLVLEYPLVGVGRGAFEPIFARLDGGDVRFTHPENIVAHWVVEWGVPVAVVLLAGLSRALLSAVRTRNLAAGAAACALGGLALHDLVDFALELPGLAVTFAVVLGAIVRRRDVERESSWGDVRRWVWPWVGLGGVTLTLLGPGVHERRADVLTEQLIALRETGAEREVRDVVSRAVAAHPLDARVALHAGHALGRFDPRESIRWLNRAMELAPSWASPHVLAADALERRGAIAQAHLEIREAEERWLRSAEPVLCRVVRRGRVDDWLAALPRDGSRRESVGNRIAACLDEDQREELDQALLLQNPPSPGAAFRRAKREFEAQNLEEALAWVTRSLASSPSDEQALRLRARVLRAKEGPARALESLDEVPGSPVATLLLRAELSAEAEDEPRLERELSRLRSAAAGDPRRLASAWAVAGRIEARRQNHGAAMQAYERAHRLDPTNTDYLRLIATLATRAGQLGRARSARSELCRLGDAAACRSTTSGESP